MDSDSQPAAPRELVLVQVCLHQDRSVVTFLSLRSVGLEHSRRVPGRKGIGAGDGGLPLRWHAFGGRGPVPAGGIALDRLYGPRPVPSVGLPN